ncbi:MAG: divergent polysaccharide deacetylase family protein [Acidobacteria bacterium]|nr:divergent polysaccharide deacetylase family protein [Acidobacteriota bacterium]
MAGARRGRGPGTPALLFLAALLLALGFGAGVLLSQQGCERRPAPVRTRELPPSPRAPTTPAYEEPAPRDTPPPPVPGPRLGPPREGSRLPGVALIIDDLGYAPPELVIRLCAQPHPFTVAVLPYLEHTRESATIAHDRGKEVILHLPMEGSPGANPGQDALRLEQGEAELRGLVRKALAEVPFRSGVNNHMGSRLTADRMRMRWVMDELKSRRLFFVDSRTTKDTVALEVAREVGVPATQRQVFLDDDKAFAEMEKQWERALALARRDGEVVVIGHIYPETVEALEKLLPRAKGEFRFVRVGELAR